MRDLHEAGFAHLDLKVENIYLDVDDQGNMKALIGDFGKAKSLINEIGGPDWDEDGPRTLLPKQDSYDSEKIDVFAAAFILLALQTHLNFSKVYVNCLTYY